MYGNKFSTIILLEMKTTINIRNPIFFCFNTEMLAFLILLLLVMVAGRKLRTEKDE